MRQRRAALDEARALLEQARSIYDPFGYISMIKVGALMTRIRFIFTSSSTTGSSGILLLLQVDLQPFQVHLAWSR